MSAIVNVTVNPWIASLQRENPAIAPLITSVSVRSDYQINWLTLQSVQGALDGVINQFANAPWCEWFIIDTEVGPKLIHRDAPFKDRNGAYIFGSSALNETYWPTLMLTDEVVIAEDLGITDNEVYSYYFTYPSMFPDGDLAYKFALINAGEFGQNTNVQQNQYTRANPLLTQALQQVGQTKQFQLESDLNYPSNPKLISNYVYKYGLKIMEIASPAIPVIDTSTGGTSTDPLGMQLSIIMNMWLVRAYEWAANMRNGTLHIMGDERAVIGKYAYQQTMKEEYYIESVDQTFTVTQPNSKGNDGTFSFTTQLGVTRGRYAAQPESGSEPAIVPPSSLNSNIDNSTVNQYPYSNKGWGSPTP